MFSQFVVHTVKKAGQPRAVLCTSVTRDWIERHGVHPEQSTTSSGREGQSAENCIQKNQRRISEELPEQAPGRW